MSRYIRIINAASDLIKEHGVPALTREAIAERADVAPGLVSHYLGTMSALTNTVMQLAVDCSDLPLLAQGLVVKHPVAMKASPEMRRKAMVFLTRQVTGA
jgi:AcrR family transcriptional regulator